jgi:hypothetical protein
MKFLYCPAVLAFIQRVKITVPSVSMSHLDITLLVERQNHSLPGSEIREKVANLRILVVVVVVVGSCFPLKAYTRKLLNPLHGHMRRFLSHK